MTNTPIIFRYLFKELIAPFFLGLSVFVFILVMSQFLRLNELIIVHGVGIFAVFKLIFYLITSFLAISIPIALLFSVLMLFGRLSADSELTALKASGFSVYQLVVPVLLFSCLVCVFCLYLTLYLEAWGARSYRREVFDIGKNKATVGIKEGVFNDDFFGLVLYTDKVDPKEKTLSHVFIYDERDKDRPVSVTSTQGTLVSSEDLPSVYLVLNRGSIYSSSKDTASVQKIDFEKYTINLSLDEDLTQDTKEKAKWLSLERLKERSAEEEKSGDIRRAREYSIEYHRRFAIAWVSLIFAIMGISLGIKPSRSVKSLSFVYTILLVGAYWVFFINMHNIAVSGHISPMVSVWIPNVVFFLLAIYLLYRANKR